MRPSKRVDQGNLSSYEINVFSIISITDNHTKVPARIWLSSKMVLVTTSLQPEQIHFKFWADLKLIYNNRDWSKYNNIIYKLISSPLY